MKQPIIHIALKKTMNQKNFYLETKKTLYLCNQAITPTKKKLTTKWEKVTCKNCLKQKPKTSHWSSQKYVKYLAKLKKEKEQKKLRKLIFYVKEKNAEKKKRITLIARR